LIWDGSTKLQYAEDCNALEDLAKHIDGRTKKLTEPPQPAEYDQDEDVGLYSEQDAWDMYLSHIAHSLILEVEDSLPWKLKDNNRENNRLTLDGRNFMARLPDGLYTFDGMPFNARYKVTDWSPKPAFDFMVENDLIGETEKETIYRITEWMTEHLVHVHTKTPEDWDDYDGFPPIDKILNPPKGTNWTYGCWGTTSLYLAMLQTVNIPTQRGFSYFAKSTNPHKAGLHSRPEFPTLDMALIHGDDPYTLDYKGHYHKVPVEKIFVTLNDLEQLIDNPKRVEENGYKPTKYEMASFNANRRSLGLAAKYRSDFLMYVRAFELLGGWTIYNSLEDVLVTKCTNDGITWNQCFWKPVFNKSEREKIINNVDGALKTLGQGDLEKGCWEAMSFSL
jgi:hypothetical protein